MKRLILLCLSLITLLSNVIIVNVHAIDNKELIYEEEINSAIIAGDGSFDNPYILDQEKAPEFTNYLISNGLIVLNQMNGIEVNNGIATCAIEDFLDNNKLHANQSRGGYWTRTSGGMSVSSNGNVTMIAIEYINHTLTKAIYNELKTDWKKEKVRELVEDEIQRGFSDTVTILLNYGIATEGAKALAAYLGTFSNTLSLVLLAQEIDAVLREEKYRIASNNNDGLLHAQFNTSYQGAWYAQTLTD